MEVGQEVTNGNASRRSLRISEPISSAVKYKDFFLISFYKVSMEIRKQVTKNSDYLLLTITSDLLDQLF